MKYWIILIAVILPFWAFAQFEGEINMKTSSKASQEEASLSWKVKGERHLMDISSTTTEYSMDYHLLIWEKEKKCWFLSDYPEKAAYVIPYANLEEGGLEVPLNSRVELQEGTEKIATFNCQKYQIFTNDSVIDVWLSADTGLSYSDFPAFMNRGDLSAVLRLSNVAGIPLKFEQKNLEGELILSQEITQITPSQLSDSDFEVPSDYTINPGKGQ